MNAKRRKEVEAIMSGLEELIERIECVQSEEEEAYDNMPEGLQESERGEQMQEYISNLEDAASSVQDAVDYLNEIFG